MYYTGDTNYYPLVCIGCNVNTEAGELISSLYVSPYGRIAFALSEFNIKANTANSCLSRVGKCSDFIRKLDSKQLDAISSDYFYKRDGQAFRVIDKMAACGYKTFSEGRSLASALNKGLRSERHLVIVPVEKDDLAKAREILKSEQFQKSDLLFAVVDRKDTSFFA